MKNLILVFFVLFGCSDDGLHYVKEIKPDIIVHPTELNFGLIIKRSGSQETDGTEYGKISYY